MSFHPVNEYFYAGCAQLSMLLEVSADPKPGNIDRMHDFGETRYEHFLASSVSAYQIFVRAYKSEEKIGRLIRLGVEESHKWQRGGNTHFGAFTLLIPLLRTSKRIKDLSISLSEDKKLKELRREVSDVVKGTDVEDTIEFYKIFFSEKIRVEDTDRYDVKDLSSLQKLKEENKSLYELMELSPKDNLVAREWVRGYPITFEVAKNLMDRSERDDFDINDSIVYEDVSLLSKHVDGLIVAKFGVEEALRVKESANEIMKDYTIEKVRKFDSELVKKGINPGCIADIIVSSLYVFLAYGGYKI
ncbi:MAG: ATP:dephospho-CoA triphosphoribosyl transferase [Candidatus Methanolliviera sp. GoM_asphalt]|nr:MAG: ATP:dephospho-CoA triphosphoribosyl transferase [Candidatus Methanolliviera sp. GoM_asphalt]